MHRATPEDFVPQRKEPIEINPGQVSRSTIIAQLLKFDGRSGAPIGKAAQNALLKMFERQCSGQEHLERVIERMLETVEFYPTPADVAQAAEYVAQASRFQDTPSYRREPGTHEGSIAENLTEADLQRWLAISNRPGDRPEHKARRALAQAFVERYYQQHPEAKP